MGGTKPTNKYSPSPADRFERTDARYNAVVMWIIAICVFAVMSAGATWMYYRYTVARLERQDKPISPLMKDGDPRQEVPEPRLQLSPTNHMTEFAHEQNQMLNTYGWVSREAGVVRIPIDRAMEIALERGLPSTGDRQTTSIAPESGAHLPQDSSSGRTYWNVQR